MRVELPSWPLRRRRTLRATSPFEWGEGDSTSPRKDSAGAKIFWITEAMKLACVPLKARAGPAGGLVEHRARRLGDRDRRLEARRFARRTGR